MLKVKGIDISRAQEQFDFTAGVKFVIIRAGIGRDEDTYFSRNIEQCRKLGIDFGCYWYVTATESEELDRQINACVKAIGDEKPSYPVFCDMEEQRQIDNLTSKERTDMALEFCDRLNKAGLPSGVYANPAWLESYYQKERIVGKRDIWLAHWTESPDIPSKFDYNQKIWQWGTEIVDDRKVDSNICFVDYPTITAKWYKEHTTSNNTVNKEDKAENKISSFKPGDKVKVKSGAVFSNGVKPISAVYTTEFVIQRLSKDGTEACIGIAGQDTGWMFCKDLMLSSKKAVSESNTASDSSSINVGDIVRIKSGSKTYDGSSVDDWVYFKRFYVSSVNGKRVVLNKSPDSTVLAINTAFNIKDLKKV